MAEVSNNAARSFAPVVGNRPRVLILGSMPGRASLAAGEYYAHPRNTFWPIMGRIAGIAEGAAYEVRLDALKQAGIALWDVLASCEREGSLDASIERDSERANDVAGLLARRRSIERVLFNGTAAETCFRRHVLPCVERRDIMYRRLPSTSPANASLRFEEKLAEWREACYPFVSGPAKEH